MICFFLDFTLIIYFLTIIPINQFSIITQTDVLTWFRFHIIIIIFIAFLTINIRWSFLGFFKWIALGFRKKYRIYKFAFYDNFR